MVRHVLISSVQTAHRSYVAVPVKGFFFFCLFALSPVVSAASTPQDSTDFFEQVTSSAVALRSSVDHLPVQVAVHFRPGGQELDRRRSDANFEARIKSLESTGGCRGCDLRGADFDEADLSLADLVRADLTAVKLNRAILTDADLGRAVLFGATLVEADLRRAKLMHADLRKANLQDSDLRGAYLLFANLRKADLRNAQLQGAFLHGADLIGARLDGANFTDADLEGALLESSDLEGAVLCRTLMPWGSEDRDCP